MYPVRTASPSASTKSRPSGKKLGVGSKALTQHPWGDRESAVDVSSNIATGGSWIDPLQLQTHRDGGGVVVQGIYVIFFSRIWIMTLKAHERDSRIQIHSNPMA